MRNFIRVILCLLMIASGICGLILGTIVTLSALRSIEVSKVIIFISALLCAYSSVCNLVCGVLGLSSRSVRSQRKLRFLAQVNVILCIISLLLAAANGIDLARAAVAAVSGIIIPEIFILAFFPVFIPKRRKRRTSAR